jgi:hypothetical protein
MKSQHYSNRIRNIQQNSQTFRPRTPLIFRPARAQSQGQKPGSFGNLSGLCGKIPKKWWKSLSTPKGKKDFDWSHLAMRYWPERVMEKVKKDPSLAVAHSDYGQYKGRDSF